MINDFILELPNFLDSDLCRTIIARYEADPNKNLGRLSWGYDTSVKQTMEIPISERLIWSDVDKIIFENLKKATEEYGKKFPILMRMNLQDHGYHLKRYAPGGFHDWHVDNIPTLPRQFIALWYLNTIDSGATEFKYYDRKIMPEEGKLVLFPAGWTHEHRGSPTKDNKYVITAWLSLMEQGAK